MNRLHFNVHGRPVPQGSLRSIPRKDGKVVTPQEPKVLQWRADIRAALYRSLQPPGLLPAGLPSDEPFEVSVDFYFRRPKSHITSKGELRKSAPLEHMQHPDVDKLLRSVLDALTGVVWNDDKQVVLVTGRKSWFTQDFAYITISTPEEWT